MEKIKGSDSAFKGGQVVSKPGAAIEVREIPITPSVQRQITRSLEMGQAASNSSRKIAS